MGIYAHHVAGFADAGLPVFPANTRDKKPFVKGWQNATPLMALRWATVPKLGAADGVGVVMGKASGIVEVDVDAAGDAWVQAALERFGDTPVIIRTASGKAKLWYRHAGEGRHIRPFDGLPVDILGGGFTIAPPSWRDDLGAAYAFCVGGIGDVGNLPTIRADAFSSESGAFKRAPAAVLRGERNNALFRHCMGQARFCDDVEALIDVAVTWSAAFPDRLNPAEAEQCARSAWQYESKGSNFLGLKKPQLDEADKMIDRLIDQPEALTLLLMFQRWHRNRTTFAVAPRAMSAAGSPPWHFSRIVRARNILLERGILEEVSAPAQGKRAGEYRLVRQTSESVHNHYTPLSPSSLALR
jgi:hypothetical protein